MSDTGAENEPREPSGGTVVEAVAKALGPRAGRLLTVADLRIRIGIGMLSPS